MHDMTGNGYGKTCTGVYSFSFNGQERDDETYGRGNAYDFGARIYDARLSKWMACDPFSKDYPFHSPYNYGLNNPIMFLDKGGNYIIDKEGNVVKFRVKKDGTLKFKGSPDPFTKQIISVMAKTETSKRVLLQLSNDKEIKVQYREMTKKESDYFNNNGGLVSELSGTTLSHKEDELLRMYDKGRIETPSELTKKINEYKSDHLTLLDRTDIVKKDNEYMANQVVVLNIDQIQKAPNSNKEFLLTASEESIHTMQDYIGRAPYGGTQRDAKHEKDILPTLEKISNEYDTQKSKKPEGK